MIVISDAGPLHYLIMIDRIDLMPRFFPEVFVPGSVFRELTHPRTPKIVQDFAQNPPRWIRVIECSVTAPQFHRLGIGEREALTVALQNPGSLILSDDGAARSTAIAERIAIIGTLGILRDAALNQWLDIRVEIERLRGQTNFRGSDALLEHVCVETEQRLKAARGS